MTHRELWKMIFGDTDRYIDFYFQERAARSAVYSKYAEHELVSMAFFTPYEVVYRGRECICPCIVGVATSPAHRHRGYMRGLLEQGLAEAQARGCPAAYLCPADEKIYEPLGFEGVQYRVAINVSEDVLKSDGGRKQESGLGWGGFTAQPFCLLEPDGKEEAAAFAAGRLREASFDFYRKRDVFYYEALQKEMAALDGEVLVVWEESRMRGVVSYIYENGCYEVTETVCEVRDGRRVFDAVCRYLGRRGQAPAVFSDGVFLDLVSGPGIVREREKRPYTMLRNLTGGEPEQRLRVYINDIT